MHIRNSLTANQPIKVGRDGQVRWTVSGRCWLFLGDRSLVKLLPHHSASIGSHLVCMQEVAQDAAIQCFDLFDEL